MKKFLLIGSMAMLAACGGGNSADTTVPTVSLVSSSPSVTAAGSITLTATAADNIGVTKVEFYDGATKLGEKTSGPYTQTVTLKYTNNGSRNYTAKAFDAAGNTATSSPAAAVTVNIVPSFVSLGTSLDITLTDEVDTYQRSLALDASGNPTVAWREVVAGAYNIYVKKWDGTTWNLVGGSLNISAAKNADDQVLALDSSGNPTVAWSETDGTSKNIYVKKWNGTAWNLVGTTFLDVNTNQPALNPSLALDSSGNPTVAWIEYDGTSYNVYVKKWNGTSWNQLGATFLDANSNRDAENPSLALDSGGNPTVVWHETDAISKNIYVKKWNGTAWALIGATFLDANLNLNAENPSLALDSSGSPTVAWHEQDGTSLNIYVKKWNGAAWALIGTTFLDANLNKTAFKPSLVLDSSGFPTVAWAENDGTSNNIYVKKWDGAMWTLLGATFLDVNLNKGTFGPSVALDSSGIPTVAWNETDGASYNVYVKRFQ